MVLLKNYRFLAVILVILGLSPLGCSQDLNPRRQQIDLQVGPVVYKTELAQTSEEMQTGLMYRTNLADNEAMLFIYDEESYLRFWMKNTLIDLSIAFIDSQGVITEIKDMKSQDLTTVPSARASQYALEVAKGSFARRGVKVGDVVDLSILNK